MIASSHAIHERQGDGLGVMGPARLRQIAPGRDAEPRGERLQEDGHQVGEQNDREQSVAEGRSAGDIGRPVAWVHVADRDQIARSDKGEHLTKRIAGLWHGHCSENLRQRWKLADAVPTALGCRHSILVAVVSSADIVHFHPTIYEQLFTWTTRK